jgi:hypothetical protein
VLLAPYASAFLSLREREGLRRPIGMSARMAFRVDRDLTSYGYLYRGVLGSDGERFFPGLVGLGLGAVALTRRRPFAGFYALAATGLVVVALGPELALGDLRSPLPYRFLFRIPPLDAMRHPYTFAAVATMLLAVLAGLGFKALALERRPVVGAAAVLFAVAETLAPGPALRPVPPGVPPAYRSLASLAPGPVLELPVFEPETLIWAARHGRPVVNGVGAFTPLHTAVLERTVQNHWVRRTPEPIEDSDPIWELADHFADLRYVILPVGRDPTWSALAADFDRSRAFELALEASDGDRVYRFRREAVTSPDAGQRREEP